MSARRSGIIIRMPSRPPSTATSMTRVISRSKPRIMSAGIVTPTPNAIDSPAEPAVCTMLFSRIVALRTPNDLREHAEQRDRHHRDRDRGAHRQADLQHEVERRRPEDHAQDGPDQHRNQREFVNDFAGGHIGRIFSGGFPGRHWEGLRGRWRSHRKNSRTRKTSASPSCGGTRLAWRLCEVLTSPFCESAANPQGRQMRHLRTTQRLNGGPTNACETVAYAPLCES